jgi:DNA-binding helix-hairpin-helix protein with protein kinase domain
MKTLLKNLLRPSWRFLMNLLPAKWHIILDHFRAYELVEKGRIVRDRSAS